MVKSHSAQILHPPREKVFKYPPPTTTYKDHFNREILKTNLFAKEDKALASSDKKHPEK